MTVDVLEREFPLFQKWAIEVFALTDMEDGTKDYVCREVLHFESGKVGRCRYYKHYVQLVRSIGGVIYIRVYQGEKEVLK